MTPPAASPDSPDDPDSPDERRVQLAVVLTGGVSLAVWMGGVVTEIQRLVRPDGPYAALRALAGTRIDIDVIGGSSAGGINGAILALALAAGTDVAAVRDIWIRDASLSQLLRDPVTDPDCTSLLRGDDYFLPRLREAFDSLAGPGSSTPATDVELILTGTLLDGVTVTRTDDFGSTFSDTVHQADFHFAKDDAHDDFSDPAVVDKLALAARATSSFPGAFEPTLCPVGADAAPVDLGPHVNFPTSRYVIDGGVLVNKPLRPVLDRILDRNASRHGERVICYVQPAPDDEAPYGIEHAPTLGRVIEAGWFSLPHSQSLARELTELAEHNAATQRRRNRIQQLIATDPDDVLARASEALGEYRTREGLALPAALPTDEAGLDDWPWTAAELGRNDDIVHAALAGLPRSGRSGGVDDGRVPATSGDRPHRGAATVLAALPEQHPLRHCAQEPLTAVRRWLLALVILDATTSHDDLVGSGPMRLLYVSAEAPNGVDARCRPSEKLAGLQLRHFGAFYKSAWRANDWMWGRLDAAARLVQLLLDPTALAERAAVDPTLVQRCLEIVRVLAGNDTEHVAESALRAELSFLHDGGPPPERLPIMHRIVTRSLHLAIVAEELPKVAAALEDDARRGHRPAPADSPLTTLRVGERDPVTLTRAFTACRLGEDRLHHDRGSAVYDDLLDRAAHLTLQLAARRSHPPEHGDRPPGRLRRLLPGSTPLLRGARAAITAQRWPLAVALVLCVAGAALTAASANAHAAQRAAVAAGALLAVNGLLVAALVARRFKAVVVATSVTAVACLALALLSPVAWRIALCAVAAADLAISAQRQRIRLNGRHRSPAVEAGD